MKPFCRMALVMLFVITAFAARSQKPATPLELNNYFAAINDTLYASGREWGKELNVAVSSKDFSTLGTIRLKMMKFIDGKQKELTTMKDIKGSDTLRKAMLEFLAFEKAMITDGFSPFEKLNNQSTKEEIKKAIDSLTDAAAREEEILKKVRTAQNSYAARNGFRIESEEE